jgi:hypothetical protein
VLDDADAHLAAEAHVAIAEIVYLTKPNSFRKMYNTTDKGTITVTTASRDRRVIYSDSSDNLYTVNAEGMKVA